MAHLYQLITPKCFTLLESHESPLSDGNFFCPVKHQISWVGGPRTDFLHDLRLRHMYLKPKTIKFLKSSRPIEQITNLATRWSHLNCIWYLLSSGRKSDHGVSKRWQVSGMGSVWPKFPNFTSLLFESFPSCYVRDDWVEYQTHHLSHIPCFQTLRSAWALFQLCLFWASKVWWRVGTSKIMRLLRNWVLRMPLGFPPWSWHLCYCLCSQCCSLLCTLRKV